MMQSIQDYRRINMRRGSSDKEIFPERIEGRKEVRVENTRSAERARFSALSAETLACSLLFSAACSSNLW
jgi:hypothetical protein